MRKLIVYLLFFISYSPLFLYLWIVNLPLPININDIKKCSFDKYDIYLLLSFVSILLFFCILKSIKKNAPYTKDINKIKIENVAFLEYIITYFFAFISLSQDSPAEIVGSIFLFLFIAYVYTKSNLIYSNPVLVLFGYSIYRASLNGSEQDIMIISRDNKITGNNIPLIHLLENIYIKI